MPNNEDQEGEKRKYPSDYAQRIVARFDLNKPKDRELYRVLEIFREQNAYSTWAKCAKEIFRRFLLQEFKTADISVIGLEKTRQLPSQELSFLVSMLKDIELPEDLRFNLAYRLQKQAELENLSTENRHLIEDFFSSFLKELLKSLNYTELVDRCLIALGAYAQNYLIEKTPFFRMRPKENQGECWLDLLLKIFNSSKEIKLQKRVLSILASLKRSRPKESEHAGWSSIDLLFQDLLFSETIDESLAEITADSLLTKEKNSENQYWPKLITEFKQTKNTAYKKRLKFYIDQYLIQNL